MVTVDASPDDALDQPTKRVQVVYGRRSTRHSPPSGVGAEHAHASNLPLQRRRSSPSPSVCASDSDRPRSPDAPGSFQFGFRDRLKELDEQFDDRDPHSSTRPLPSPSSQAAGRSRVTDLQSVSMGTASISSQAHRSSGYPSHASLSPLPTSLHPTLVHEHPPESSSVPRRAHRVQRPPLCESETEEPSKSSSVSPVRHVITTPLSRSSPTPPTSGEIQMVSRKTKGKAPARDVLPLVFDDERPSATEFPIKVKKGRRSEPPPRPKTKAPTKKERRETALESSRIAASRPVELIRTEEQKHTLSTFFAGLRRDNIVTPTLGAELPSDPIEKFSSPSDKPTQLPPLNSVFGAPSGLLRTSKHVGASHQLSASEGTKTLPRAADDSDDEMPSVTSLLRGAGGRQQRLQEIKHAALQHADINSDDDDDDDDDDLLVVKDDMHAVAREEATHRRLDKALGSPTKNIAMLRKINHPSIRPIVVSPRKPFAQQLQEYARPSFARTGKGSKGRLTKRELDRYMMSQHTKEQLKSINRYEEEWVKGGGKLLRDAGGNAVPTSLSQKLDSYAEQGLKIVEVGGTVDDGTSTYGSDEDFAPDLRSSASPGPVDADEDEPSDSMEVLEVPQLQVDGDEEEVAPLRHSKAARRRPLVVMGSEDEGEETGHANVPNVRRDSAFSMESQTEDENDKENSAKLMYDRSDDKENKAVVRHELSASEMPFVSRLESIVDDVGGSLASVADFDDAPGSPTGDVRSPLKDISKDDDDLFRLSSPVNSSFTERLLHSTVISPPRPSASTPNLGSPPVLRSERVGRINRLSFGSENDENDPSGFKPPQPSFLERLHSQTGPDPSLPSINPLPSGGFSQLFSAEEGSLTKIANGPGKDLSLTLDVGLKPALEVGGTLKRKAETIFEKEQEYVVAAVQQKDGQKELLYVNDHGFLTQTRPEDSSPQVYRMSSFHASSLISTQPHPTQLHLISARTPLRTLSLSVPQELSPGSQPLKRLRRRSLSPSEQKVLGQSHKAAQPNAFDILGKSAKPPPKAQRLEKSEFVAVEAEESDEDDMFGFGGPKKEDDEEEDDIGRDKVVEGLVDDAAMDVETEAADLVLEKHREHEEEDDQRLQKLHQDAIEGKFRIKRRYGGVGLEDDIDEDDDDDARRIRQRIHKKRKIEGDSLEALGQNEETRAFYDTYHQDLIDEDDEFRHLREGNAMHGDDDDDDDDDDAPPKQLEQDTVSVDEIRQRVREMAQSNSVLEMLDPEDTSWIDKSMMAEADGAVHVKVVEYRKSSGHHPHAGQMDFDIVRPGQHAEDEQERKQMVSWARHQSRQHQGTGRSGNNAAVTGHGKAKAGGGSLRSVQSKNASTASEASKVKTSSLLSTVSNRRGKFACG